MSIPFFSIIIPTFNSAKTLQKCLESILCQTFINFEVLIMDGVSTDATLAIAKSMTDERIKIYSAPDEGIYDAMNKGIALAKGEWLYFLGSDDELYSSFILSKVTVIIKESIEQVIYGNVIIKGDAGWAKDGEIYAGEFDQLKLQTKNICHQAVFYSRNVFSNHTYDIKNTICADYALNLKLFTHYKFKHINEIIAIFKGGGRSFVPPNQKSNTLSIIFLNGLINKAKIIKSFITPKRAK